MASILAVPTQIDLSSGVIRNIVIEMVDMAQALGLSSNKQTACSTERYAYFLELIERYNNFDPFPFPFPDQRWT